MRNECSNEFAPAGDGSVPLSTHARVGHRSPSRYNSARFSTLYCRVVMELNPTYNAIKDMQSRIEALRGYL